jgi:hypothetical protein
MDNVIYSDHPKEFKYCEGGLIEVHCELRQSIMELSEWKSFVRGDKYWDGFLLFGGNSVLPKDIDFNIMKYFPQYDGECTLITSKSYFGILGIHKVYRFKFVGNGMLKYKGKEIK